MHIADSLSERVEQAEVIDSLIGEMTGIEIDAEAWMMIDSLQRALHGSEVESDLGRMDLQRKVDVDTVERIQNRCPAAGEILETLIPVRL